MKFGSFILLPLVGARVIRDQQQLSRWSIEPAAPGIGVHFTTSYATAAIKYQNGTLQDIVRVRADGDYIDLMGRLADPSNHQSKQSCNGMAKRLFRRGRKLLGLPPTSDVAILSSFFQKVKVSIEGELGFPVSQIMPAFPVLIALNREDIRDALKLAELTPPQASRQDVQSNFHETTAAYAGLGHGLCESWKDISECVVEEQKMPYEHVLFLNFDNSSFSATVQYMQSTGRSWVYSSAVEPSLGWWNLPVYEVPRAQFWGKIHEVVLDIAGALQQAPHKIILLGEHSADEEFLEVVKTALWEVLEYDITMLLETTREEDVGILGARGAAELARRAHYLNQASEEDGMEL